MTLLRAQFSPSGLTFRTPRSRACMIYCCTSLVEHEEECLQYASDPTPRRIFAASAPVRNAPASWLGLPGWPMTSRLSMSRPSSVRPGGVDSVSARIVFVIAWRVPPYSTASLPWYTSWNGSCTVVTSMPLLHTFQPQMRPETQRNLYGQGRGTPSPAWSPRTDILLGHTVA